MTKVLKNPEIPENTDPDSEKINGERQLIDKQTSANTLYIAQWIGYLVHSLGNPKTVTMKNRYIHYTANTTL